MLKKFFALFKKKRTSWDGAPTVIELADGHFLYIYRPSWGPKGEIQLTVASNIGNTRIKMVAGVNVAM